MDLFAEYDFHELASLSNGASSRLSPHELQCAKAAARTLMSSTKTSRAHCWGKLTGLAADYIVIFLFNEDPLHEGDSEGSNYYASIDGAKTFTLVPPPFEVAKRVADVGVPPTSPSKQQHPDHVKSRVIATHSDAANAALLQSSQSSNNNSSISSAAVAAAGPNGSPVKVRGADGSGEPASALPEVAVGSVTLDSLCRMLSGPFSGNPALEYRIPAERIGATTTTKDVFFCVREIERLACFIHEVNTHCCAVPRGAVEQRERPVIAASSHVPSAAATGGVAQAQRTKEAATRLPLKLNPHFNGLSRADAGRLSSYLHLRALTERVATTLEKEGAAATIDCLEPLSLDEPATTDASRPGAWTVRYEPVNDVVYGASNTFPGAMFFHKPNSAAYGSVYVGDGMQSTDVLPFML